MHYSFTNEYPASKVDEIVSYLLGPRLWIPQDDYPDFTEWAQTVHVELKGEKKRALIAVSAGHLVGATIYQRHKTDPDALEIKNLTVRPDHQGRHIASFLLRNTEIEGARDYRTRFITIDTKARNLPIRFFLERHKYRLAGRDDLYGLSAGTDVIYRKTIPFNACP
jgi:ribosomal protein S18 acetylase RimI-like enzyme